MLTFVRPPRNFMTAAGMAELGERLGGLAERDDVAMVLLTGGVPGYFVAHADLAELGRLGRGERRRATLLPRRPSRRGACSPSPSSTTTGPRASPRPSRDVVM